MKNIIILIVYCAISFSTLGQIFNVENNKMIVNQVDSNGRKSGVWIESTSWLNYYYNGKVNGPSIIFRKSNDNSITFDLIVQQKKGKFSGSTMSFHPNGVVSYLLVNVTPNTDFVGAQKIYSHDFVFPYQAYCYEFYPDGNLKAKGWMILGEDFEMDNERVGLWNFYGSDGEETRDYSKSE